MMNENSRLFDCLDYQLANFSKEDTFACKENGKWKKYSTENVKETVNKLSAGLIKMGVNITAKGIEEQEKIAVISKNRPEWLMLDLACQQIGAVLTPIYPTTNANELNFILNDAAVKYIFISGKEIFEKVTGIKETVKSLIQIFSFDEIEGAQNWTSLLQNINTEQLQKVEEIKVTISNESCATIIYTSGTTGTPKGVMLSHKNIITNVINSIKTFPFEDKPTGRTLSFLPLNHIFEKMVSYIYINTGISIYYAESLETIGENLLEVKPTLFCTVPRLLEKVFEKIMSKGAELTGAKKKLFYWAVSLANKYDNIKSGGIFYNLQLSIANKLVFSKWREALGGNIEAIITGGAACQVKLIRIFTAAKLPIYEGYGPTENSPVISVNCKKEGGTKFGTVGLPIQGQQVKLADDGEILVKGPSVMMGYYKRPDLTAETLIDGWLHTGDIGIFEDEKYLKITDRKKELFKTSGGKYVAPQAIENKMKESPFIEQIMVLGADEKFVSALIVPSITNIKDWMTHKNINFTTETDAINHPQVLKLFREILDSFNQQFNHVEQVKKFELLPYEWSIESGEMTPKLSLKRKVIMEKYKDAIDRIYK